MADIRGIHYEVSEPVAAIFQTRTPEATAGTPNRRSALVDMIWNGLGSRASSLDADATPPLAPDRQISSGNAYGSASSSGDPGAVSTVPMLMDPQDPLSLNAAYLEYLKRLNVARS